MFRSAARLLLVLWTLVMVVAMLTPGEQLPAQALLSYDKLIHLSSFGLWTILAALATPTGQRHRARLIFGAGLLLAVGTEGAQALFPHLQRSGDVFDALADLLGVGLGLWVMAMLGARRGPSPALAARPADG